MPGGSAGSPMSVAGEAGRMQERDYASATMAMHDHLSRIAPGMCPMSPPVGEAQKPGRPVPEAVGMPVPHKAKASKADRAAAKAAARAKAARKAANVAARKAKAEKRKLRRQALKAAAAAPVLPPVAPEVPAVLDADAVAAAVKAVTAPLVRRIERQDKALRKNQKVLNAIAGQPDTTQAPFRGAGITKTSAAPSVTAPRTAAEAAELAQASNIRRLQKQWRDSYNPAEREAAWQELTTQLGINPMTGTPDNTHPFRT